MWLLALSSVLLAWTVFSAGGMRDGQFAIAALLLAILAGSQAWHWIAANRQTSRQQPPPRWLTASAVAVLGVMVVQCVPLPQSWALAFWPERTVAIQALAAAGVSDLWSWQTISLRPAATVDAIMQFLAVACMFVVAYSISTKTRVTLEMLLVPIVIIGALQAGFALFAASPSGAEHVTTGSFVNRNHFASLVSLSLPITVALGLRAGIEALHDQSYSLRNAMLAVCWFGLGGLQLFAMVLSQSRGGYIVTLCGLAALGMLIVLRSEGGGKRYVSTALLGVGLILLLAIPTPRLLKRFGQTSEPDGVSIGMRMQIWKNSADLLCKHWFLGVGAGAYEDAFVAHNDFAAGRRVDYAHNDYLQLLVELGLLGSLAVLALAAAISWQVFAALLRVGGDNRVLLSAAVAALFAFALHEVVEFNFAIPALALIVGWLCGVLCGQSALLQRAVSNSGRAYAIELRRGGAYSLRGGVA